MAYAHEFTNHSGEPSIMIEVERYLKHGGRWLFLCHERSIPTMGPFEEFVQRYCNDDSMGVGGGGADEEESPFGETWREKAGKRSDGSDWTYSFELVGRQGTHQCSLS